MPTFYSPKKLHKDCGKVLATWRSKPELRLGDLTCDVMKQALDDYEKARKELIANRMERMALQKRRDDLAKVLAGGCTRFRNGVRAVYGPDSTEYAQAGGVRTSARKKPRRTAVPEEDIVETPAKSKAAARRKKGP